MATMRMAPSKKASLEKPNLYNQVQQLWRTNPALTLNGLAMLIVLVGCVVGIALDPTVITGMPAWDKPAKFSISLSIYSFTLAWLSSFMPRYRRVIAVATVVVAVGAMIEMAAIALQAARHTTSHFNLSTPFNTFVFEVMGVTIAFIFAASVLIAALMFFQPIQNKTVAWAIRLGLIVTCIGMSLGGLMLMPTQAQTAQIAAGITPSIVGGHSVGVVDGGPGLPFLGWSTVGGDLRIPHFFGLHALQVLPLAGWLISRLPLKKLQQVQLVWVAAISYLALILILTSQALRGQSIIAPDMLTLLALSGLVAATAISSTAIIRRGQLLN